MEKRLFIILTAIYCCVGQPFLFSALFLGGRQYLIKLIILTIFMCTASKYKNTLRKIQKWFVPVIIWFLLSSLVNFDSFLSSIYLMCDILFFTCFYIIISNSRDAASYVYKLEMRISLIVAFSCITATILLLMSPGAFMMINDLDGYPVLYNRFVGLISIWGQRVCWFFAEPSYCGFYLGLHVLLFLNDQDLNWKKRTLAIILLLGALLVVFSRGSLFYLPIAILLYFLDKYKKYFSMSRKFITTILYCSIVFVNLILPKFDVSNIEQDQIDISKETSFDDRQSRMVLADKVIDDLGPQLIIGLGVDSVAKKYGVGISDAYRKMLAEQGVFFLIVFLMFLRKLTINNFAIHSYIILSYLSVIIHATPLIMVIYYISNFQVRQNNIKLIK